MSFDCSKCPGYCCSYTLIEVSEHDIKRLGKRFGLTAKEAKKKFTRYDKQHKTRTLRRQRDNLFGKVCAFFDKRKRCCSIYEHRPNVCRRYPFGSTCGYWQFLKFERNLQQDKDFVATTR